MLSSRLFLRRLSRTNIQYSVESGSFVALNFLRESQNVYFCCGLFRYTWHCITTPARAAKNVPPSISLPGGTWCAM